MPKPYFLVIFDARFHRRFLAFHFSKRDVLFCGLFGILLVVSLCWCLFVYTPLRNYIPGYPDEQTRRDAVQNAIMADSLKRVTAQWESYLVNIQRILQDQEPLSLEEMFASQPGVHAGLPQASVQGPSREDSLLRAGIREREKYAVSTTEREVSHIEGILFFPPVKGIISNGFDASAGHYAIDIAAQDNTLVMAVLNGTVTLATWTEDTGYVLQIQHDNNLISVYKHCAKLFNKEGDTVRAGAAVGVIGDTGNLSTGNHLHFELWHKGTPLNPANYINF